MKGLYRPLYNLLTAGETVTSLEHTIRNLRRKNVYAIADYIKEYSKTNEEIRANDAEYKKLAHIQDLNYIALKPSSFNFNSEHIYPLVDYLVRHKKKILIDAENVEQQEKIQTITNECIQRFNTHTVSIYKTYQMYRRDSFATLQQDMRIFPRLGVKLVRGAYWNQDKLTGALFLKKSDTDTAFRDAMILALANRQHHTMVCTHNTKDIHFLIDSRVAKQHIVHASLYGFLPELTNTIVRANIETYKYLPYGKMEDAFPYLFRRVLENPYILRYYFI